MKRIALYKTPDAMEPLFPINIPIELENLAIDLLEKSAILTHSLNPITGIAIAEFLRPMNSFYSNLIEGHDTHPIDIEKALKGELSIEKTKRNLQLEANAHINVHRELFEEINALERINPYAEGYIKSIHNRFYSHLPEEFKNVITREGATLVVEPGKFRTTEVEVGRHVAPKASALPVFMERFHSFYTSKTNNKSHKIDRIIAVAASHHRLSWAHPFLDGNGRVARLFSDALFMSLNINPFGLWTVSRGLARVSNEYKMNLSKADSLRINDFDGRGNLSNKRLIDFCTFFLEVAVDQVEFMLKVLDPESMKNRVINFAELMIIKKELRPEATFVLVELFKNGRISKKEALWITRTSDKTLKLTIDKLVEMDLLNIRKEGKSMMYYAKYPIKYSPSLFPGLYPANKEIDMLDNY